MVDLEQFCGRQMPVAVIGLGVGYALSCALAESEYDIIGIDIDPDAVKNPRRDRSVDALFDMSREKILQHIRLTTNYEAILNCDPIIVCVSTGDEKQLILGHVEDAVRQCLRILRTRGTHPTILVYSTLPFGSSKTIARIFVEEKVRLDGDVDYCYMPLMIAQGTTAHDFVNPPFIVFGAYSKPAAEKVMSFYLEFIQRSSLFRGETPPHFVTDPETAELCKLVANAFLSTKISFSNMIAAFCEKNHLDGKTLLEIVGSDRRIGKAMLRPGYSFGGACFPRDLDSLIKSYREKNVPCPILDGTKEVNVNRLVDPLRVIEAEVLGRNIMVLGRAYKAGLRDTRGSPALALISNLRDEGYRVSTYDPNFDSEDDLKKALSGGPFDAVVVTTSETAFNSKELFSGSGGLRAILDFADAIDPDCVPEPVRIYKTGMGWIR